MAADKKSRQGAAELRRRAEEKVASQKASAASSQETDKKRLLHELQVHQIELEMQNEELHMAMAELSEHKDRLEKVIKNTPAGYFHIDREGRFLEVNDAWLRMHGYDSPDEVIGKHFSMMQVDQESDSALAHLGELKKGVAIPYGEFSSRRKDGSVGHHIFSAHPDVHVGDIVGFEWFIIDISERRQIEEKNNELKAVQEETKALNEQLTANIESFSNIVERTTDGIVIIGSDEIIKYFNKAAKLLLNRTDEELLNTHFGCPIGADTSVEIDIVHATKGLVAVEMRSAKTEWKGEDALVVVLRDISEHRLYEESLIKTSEELKKLDGLKSEFISIASHELRTPLTSIKNAVDIILKGKAGAITEGQEKFLFMAQRNINRLSALINDMLNISKIESGKMTYEFIPVNISEIIDHVINTLKPLADNKSMALNLDIPPDLPLVLGDACKIEQVLINLVGNAIKFTPEQGAVNIAANLRRAAPDKPEEATGYLEISITDTGIGIPEEHKEHLFEKFYQATHSLARQDQSGTGLGLSISKGIMEGHKGKIWFESTEGSGSKFHIALPLSEPDKQLHDMLEADLAKAKKHADPLSLLIVRVKDIESLKNVSGENNIEKITEQIKEKIISGGIKTTDKIAVSLPDNEIALILPDTVKSGAEQLQKRVMRYISGKEDALNFVNCLIGFVATYPEDGTSAKELIEFARGNLENSNIEV